VLYSIEQFELDYIDYLSGSIHHGVKNDNNITYDDDNNEISFH